MDPTNAQTYRANAQAGQAQLKEVLATSDAQVAPAKGQSFIVFHDAYHYFEARFDIEATASVSTGDAAAPGAARVATLREHVADVGADCAFAEPQINTELLNTIVEGQGTRLATLDPLGASLSPGPDLYPDLLLAIAGTMATCLTP